MKIVYEGLCAIYPWLLEAMAVLFEMNEGDVRVQATYFDGKVATAGAVRPGMRG